LVESETPVPRNWHDPTSVERYQARLDSERNVLMKLNNDMLTRCQRLIADIIRYPKYFGDPLEESGLLRSNPDFYESENLPPLITGAFTPLDVEMKEGPLYSDSYYSEEKVDRELWIEQTYRTHYQEAMKAVYVELILFEKELLTESATSIFVLRYTRLLMIDKRLSEISNIVWTNGPRNDSAEVSKPHVVVKNFLYL